MIPVDDQIKIIIGGFIFLINGLKKFVISALLLLAFLMSRNAISIPMRYKFITTWRIKRHAFEEPRDLYKNLF